MLEEVLVILLLTILFTFSTVFAYLVRKSLRGGCGQSMYLIWLAVMLAAVIPLQIAPPMVNVIVSERTVTEVEPPYRDMHPEIMMIADAAREIRGDELPVLRAHLIQREDAVISARGDAVAFNVSGLMVAGLRFLIFVWAVGFSYCLIRELLEYRDIRRYLYENSDPLTDEDMLLLFHRCREHIGLRRHIPLRRIREDFPMTPCVIGFGRPAVFLSAFCDDMDSSTLANIFTHELCHVKRGDMLYKLLMVLTISVHWFNPISILLRRAVTEDLELSCDASVLRYRTAVSVRDYMESILTVAERVRRERQARRQCEPMFRAAFFMANDTTPSYLKRRYLHMKTTREKKNWKTVYSVCAGFLALICAANVAVLSSCSYVRATDELVGSGTVTEEPYLCDPIETAFANYFCVADYDDITDEQFAQIESVDVYLVLPEDDSASVLDAYGGKIPPQNAVYHNTALIVINGGVAEYLMPQMLPLDIYENEILPTMDAWRPNDTAAKKFRAFYCVRDPNDPELEPRAAAEMKAMFPITKEMAVSMYDPFTTAREDDFMYSLLYEAGLVNETAFSETALRAKLSSISALDGAEIQIFAASELAEFGVDTEIFRTRGESYRGYNAEYRMYMEELQKQSQEYHQGKMELDQQIDINGNGIIGE